MLGQLSLPVYLIVSGTHVGRCQSSLKGKTFLTNMADTHDTKCTLVPDTEGKSDLWKHLNLCKQKTDGQTDPDDAVCKQCASVVKLHGRHLRHVNAHEVPPSLILLGSSDWNKQKADLLVYISRYTSILCWYGQKIPVPCTGTFFCCCTGTQLWLSLFAVLTAEF